MKAHGAMEGRVKKVRTILQNFLGNFKILQCFITEIDVFGVQYKTLSKMLRT